MNPSTRVRSAEEQSLWSLKLKKHLEHLSKNTEWIHPEYLQGLNVLDLKDHTIPSLESLNEKLKKISWKIAWTETDLSVSKYAAFISKKTIPVFFSIENKNGLKSDFFQDVVLKTPMFFSQEYSHYISQLSLLITRAQPNLLDFALAKAKALGRVEQVNYLIERLKEHPSELTHLSRVFNWTIEYGMLVNSKRYMLYGSKALNFNEEGFIFNNLKKEILVATSEVIREDRETALAQNRIYAVPGFDALNRVLRDYSKGMAYHYSATDSV